MFDITKKKEWAMIKFLKNLFAPLWNDRAWVDEPDAEAEPAGDDYFSQFTKLVDDSGKEIESGEPDEKKTGEPAGEKKGAEDPTKKQGDAEPEKKGEEKKPEPLKDVPEGFEGRFFQKGEKGDVTFKAEDALGFMLPDKDSEQAFRYSPISVITEEQAKTRTGETPVAPKSTKDELLEMNKHFQEVEEKMLSPISLIASAIDKGYSVEQALAYAQQETRKYLTTYQSEKKAEFEANYYDRLEKTGSSKESSSKVMQQAQINEAKMHQWFGGKEQFESVFFAHKGKDGKLQPGLATEDLWMAFRIANPGVEEKKLTSAELQKEMSDWYPKFASRMENLLWLRKVAMATLFEKTKPHLFDAVRKNAGRGAQTKGEGKQYGPGGVKTPAKGSKGEASALDAFLHPNIDRSGIATI